MDLTLRCPWAELSKLGCSEEYIRIYKRIHHLKFISAPLPPSLHAKMFIVNIGSFWWNGCSKHFLKSLCIYSTDTVSIIISKPTHLLMGNLASTEHINEHFIYLFVGLFIYLLSYIWCCFMQSVLRNAPTPNCRIWPYSPLQIFETKADRFWFIYLFILHENAFVIVKGKENNANEINK